ncbi:MAG: hypothetical protein HC898_13075 [Phycisphaerales bacterium]|nr:hypothetical protein [Phycisphaerales bacterium]
MKRRLISTVVLLLIFFIGLPCVAIAQSSRLTLAAYNTQWLLDVFDDPYTSDEGIKPKPHEELVALAKALRAVDADVVGLSELENEGVLKAFVAELLPDMGTGTSQPSPPTVTGGRTWASSADTPSRNSSAIAFRRCCRNTPHPANH